MRSFFENVLTPVFYALTATLIFSLVYMAATARGYADLSQAAVKVVRANEKGGGTGIALNSSNEGTEILTNAHVCNAVGPAGIVVDSKGRKHLIEKRFVSTTADLCLVFITANLGINTPVATSAPRPTSDAYIAGHPALFPTVITQGLVSERLQVTIMTGMRKCSEAEFEDISTGWVCIMFGGMPQIKSYQSELVSATIMAGSSGSGVYNSRGELHSVVYAGTGGLSYAITMPYETLRTFLAESREWTQTNLQRDALDKSADEQAYRKRQAQFNQVVETCKLPGVATSVQPTIRQICEGASRSLLLE